MVNNLQAQVVLVLCPLTSLAIDSREAQTPCRIAARPEFLSQQGRDHVLFNIS